MKGIVIYYSYSGNTSKVASFISNYLGVESIEIKTKENIFSDENIIKQSQKLIKNGFEPQLEKISYNLSDYDFIILGCPVWWFTCAPAIVSFLKNNDFTNKIIYPFSTTGSWKGHIFKDIEKYALNSIVKKGLYLNFSNGEFMGSKREIQDWLDKIKLDMKIF